MCKLSRVVVLLILLLAFLPRIQDPSVGESDMNPLPVCELNTQVDSECSRSLMIFEPPNMLLPAIPGKGMG